MRLSPSLGRVLPLLAVLAAGAACTALAPTQQMSDARQAVRAARTAGAEERAPASYVEAQRLLATAADALRVGRYDLAERDAVAARDAAIRAQELSGAIEAAADAVEAARDAGRPWQGGQVLLDQALQRSRLGDEAGALALARQALRRLESGQ